MRIEFHQDWQNLHIVGEDELSHFGVRRDTKPQFDAGQTRPEFEQPLDGVNSVKLAEWLDNRIVDFVQTYLALHENHYYLQDHMVEDPIAKVRFPKFAAAAKLEQNGTNLYFIDESTLREFQKRGSERPS